MNELLGQTIKVFEDDKKLLMDKIESALNFKANQKQCLESSSNMPEYFRQKICNTIEALDAQLYVITNLCKVYVKCLKDIKKRHRMSISHQQLYH